MSSRPTESPRDDRGRFTRSRYAERRAHKVAQLRAAVLRSIKSRDMGKVVAALLDRAKQGDAEAADVLFRWALGPAVASDLADRVAALETALGQLGDNVFGDSEGRA